MSTRARIWFLGCALAAGAAGVCATACSGSSNGGSAGDSGAGDVTTGEGGGGSSSGGSSSGGSSGGGDGGVAHEASVSVDCGTQPVAIAAEGGTPADTLVCVPGDGGLSCKAGEQCCIGGKLAGGQQAPTECAEYGTPCLNGADSGAGAEPALVIQCFTVASCAADGVPGPSACCLKGAQAPTPACTFPYLVGGTAVVCEGPSDGGDAGGVVAGDAGDAGYGCGPGEAQVCTTKADCPPAKTCVPGKWRDYVIGFCE